MPSSRVTVSMPVSSRAARASNGSAATSARMARSGATTRSGAAGSASAAMPSAGLAKQAAAPAPSASTATAIHGNAGGHPDAVPPRSAPTDILMALVIDPGPSRCEVVGVALVGTARRIGGVQHDADHVGLHQAQALESL